MFDHAQSISRYFKGAVVHVLVTTGSDFNRQFIDSRLTFCHCVIFILKKYQSNTYWPSAQHIRSQSVGASVSWTLCHGFESHNCFKKQVAEGLFDCRCHNRSLKWRREVSPPALSWRCTITLLINKSADWSPVRYRKTVRTFLKSLGPSESINLKDPATKVLMVPQSRLKCHNDFKKNQNKTREIWFKILVY